MCVCVCLCVCLLFVVHVLCTGSVCVLVCVCVCPQTSHHHNKKKKRDGNRRGCIYRRQIRFTTGGTMGVWGVGVAIASGNPRRRLYCDCGAVIRPVPVRGTCCRGMCVCEVCCVCEV